MRVLIAGVVVILAMVASLGAVSAAGRPSKMGFTRQGRRLEVGSATRRVANVVMVRTLLVVPVGRSLGSCFFETGQG